MQIDERKLEKTTKREKTIEKVFNICSYSGFDFIKKKKVTLLLQKIGLK